MVALSLDLFWRDHGAERGLRGIADLADKAGEAFGSMSKAVGAGALAAGVTAGGVLAQGFTQSLDLEAGRAKLGAQLGLTADKSAEMGKVAGSLYAQNYGQSMEEVNDALRSVVQNIDGMKNASNESLEAISKKVLNLQSTTGETADALSRSVSQMLRTGMVKNADEAIDLLTVGFQKGVNKSEDLLDTFNEYGTQFRKVGLDGKDAMGILSQGLQAGARDADLVADSIKEFSIRAIDGSDSTKEGFKELGLSSKQMADDIAAGGPRASEALDKTLDKLREIKDPADRSAAAVKLFGTQAEDMGEALFALDLSTASKEMGNVAGAADKMDKTLGETSAAKIETMKRGFQQWTQELVTTDGAMGTVTTGVAAFGGPGLEMAGQIGMLVAGFSMLNPAMILANLSAARLAVTSGISRAATATWTAAQWLLNAALTANPIGMVVVAIGLLVAAFVLAWKHSDKFKEVMVKGLRVVVNHFMGMAETVLNGAAKAFGWMPGIGPKLETAAKEFTKFKTRVNLELNKIQDEKVNVDLKLNNDIPTTLYGVRVAGGYGSRRGGITMATGGAVRGPGTGTSDDVPIWGSNGEHMWTAREVNAAGGHGAVEALRKAVLGAGGAFAAYRDGGAIKGPDLGPALYSGARAIGAASAKAVQETARKALESVLGTAALGGGGGWQSQWAALHSAIPSAKLISSFRPGAVTTLGTQSMHALGRAIDVSPSMQIFNWIVSRYGKKSKEVIYSPANNRQIHNGSPHMYTGAIRQMHFDHVHWGYDQGGDLQPGWSSVYNGTGRPERVLSGRQTDRFDQMVRVLERGAGASSPVERIDYARLGDQVARAFTRSGVSVSMDGRVVGQVIGKSASLIGRSG